MSFFIQFQRVFFTFNEGFTLFFVRSFNFSLLQIEYIKEHCVDKVKQQIEFTKLLENEIKLMNEIQKRRNKIRKEAHDKQMDQMLDKMGAPVKWIGYKSKSVLVSSTSFLKIKNCVVYLFIYFLLGFFCPPTDIKCEMDLLQCQKIRKLTTLYRQLKTSGTNRIDRVEFLSELHRILFEEPHSQPLEEVYSKKCLH